MVGRAGDWTSTQYSKSPVPAGDWPRLHSRDSGIARARASSRRRFIGSLTIVPEMHRYSYRPPIGVISLSSATMNKNRILIDLSESDKTKFGKLEFAEQSLPQRVFSAIWALESEVNNGGFTQYFLNSSAESASFVVQALEIIGAPKTASICNRAIVTAFPSGLPATVEAIRSVAADFPDEIPEKLETLDQEFFAYPHNLTDLLFAYVS